jgi:hypothetical protein
MNLKQLEEAKNEIEFWESFWKMSGVLNECRLALEYIMKLAQLKTTALPRDITYIFDDSRRRIVTHINQTERDFHQFVTKNRDRPLKERASEIVK